METHTPLIRHFINGIGQKLPRRIMVAVSALPPKAAATIGDRGGS